MGTILSPLTNLLRYHKLKTLGVLLIAAFFTVLCFPSDDLSDWVSSQVNRTPGLYVQMDGLKLDIFSGFSVVAENLQVEARGFPAIKAGTVELSPLISKLITFRPGVSASLGDFFGGHVDVEYSQDAKAKSGAPFDELAVQADRVSLDDLTAFLRAAGILGLSCREKFARMFQSFGSIICLPSSLRAIFLSISARFRSLRRR
jgi:hypothetical protein